MRPLALLLGALAASACDQEPRQLVPKPEVLIVVDTDAVVPQIYDRLQIDLYLPDASGGAPVWFFSESILRASPDDWPVSFAIGLDDIVSRRQVVVRLRLHPDQKVRDNRGERFFSDASLAAYIDACPTFLDADASTDGLLRPSGDPSSLGDKPLFEPQPNVTIDRLLVVELEPAVQGTVTVLLSARCSGIQADLFSLSSCTDGGVRREPVAASPIAPELVVVDASKSAVGSFPPALPCTVDDPAADAGQDAVCIGGGSFLLGDPAVFGFGEFDGFPERAAVIRPVIIDRHEVSVGRFRDALIAGRLAGVELPIANDEALAEADADPEQRRCTFSTSPQGREDYPLNCVSFDTARAFCRATGGDLPTEAQWEYVAAAAGRDGETRYAWGSDEPSCQRAVYARRSDLTTGATDCVALGYGVAPLASTDPVAGDATPERVVGLGGSLREWVLDDYRAYCSACWSLATLEDPICEGTASELRTVRGGDWSRGADSLLVGLRDTGFEPSTRHATIGFRCARDGAQETGDAP